MNFFFDINIFDEKYLQECYNSFFNNDFSGKYFLYESANLSKFGVQNSSINKSAKDIVNIIKKDGVGKESRKKIHNIISDLFEQLAKTISFKSIIENDKFKEVPRPKLKRAIILFIWVLVINTLLNVILSLFLTPKIGQLVTTIAVAPLVEESSKLISIKGGFDKEYFIVFNVLEASLYIGQTLPAIGAAKAFGGDASILTKGILRARGAAIGMHGINTIIHKIFNSDKVKEVLKIKNDKEAKDKSTFASFIIGVLVHGTWNAAACLSPAFNVAISGINSLQ